MSYRKLRTRIFKPCSSTIENQKLQFSDSKAHELKKIKSSCSQAKKAYFDSSNFQISKADEYLKKSKLT